MKEINYTIPYSYKLKYVDGKSKKDVGELGLNSYGEFDSDELPSSSIQIDASVSYDEAKERVEEEIKERYKGVLEIDDFWIGDSDVVEEKRVRVRTDLPLEEVELKDIERSGKWDDSYSRLCDELATYEKGGSVVPNDSIIANYYGYKAYNLKDYEMDNLRMAYIRDVLEPHKEKKKLDKINQEIEIKVRLSDEYDSLLKQYGSADTIAEMYDLDLRDGRTDEELKKEWIDWRWEVYPYKYEEGGEIRTLGKSDSVIYKGETWYVTEKNGQVGIMSLRQGAWGSDFPFIPLTSIIQEKELTDMYGNKVFIPYSFDSYAEGGGVVTYIQNIDGIPAQIKLDGKTIEYDFKKERWNTDDYNNEYLKTYFSREWWDKNDVPPPYKDNSTYNVGGKVYGRKDGKKIDLFYKTSKGQDYYLSSTSSSKTIKEAVDKYNKLLEGSSQTSFAERNRIKELEGSSTYNDGGEVPKVETIVYSPMGEMSLDEYRNLSNEDMMGESSMNIDEVKAKVFIDNEEAYDYEDEIRKIDDVDELADFLYENGLAQADNTYNYSWWGGERQFYILNNNGSNFDLDYPTILFLSKHRDGDVRGNYEKFEAFRIIYGYEEIPFMSGSRLTFIVTDRDKKAVFSTDDMEGYELYVEESDFDDYDEGDSTNVDEVEEKLGISLY